jgi:hypothetical protein
LESKYKNKLSELEQALILKKQTLEKTYERHITEALLKHNQKAYEATKS